MERELPLPGLVKIAEFARVVGVGRSAISKAVRAGRLRLYDIRGGRVSPDYAGRKWLKSAEAVEDWRSRRRLRFNDDDTDSGGDLAAARTRSAGLQAELLQIRLDRLQGELIPLDAARAAAKSLGRAVGRALDGLLDTVEEAAGQTGGLPTARGVFRNEIRKAREDIANMLVAEAAKFTPHED